MVVTLTTSDAALPRPAVAFRAGLGGSASTQLGFSYRIEWAGRIEEPVIVSVPKEGGNSAVMRQSVILEAGRVASGSYPYRLLLSNIWARGRFGTVRTGRILVDNATDSAFGPGWRLRGLYALNVSTPDGVTLVRPGTRPVYYRSDGAGGYVRPRGDFSTLSALPEGAGYRYMEKDGTAWEFDPQGKLAAHKDRNHNTTSYRYDSQDRLVSVTDPVGLVTQLRYRHGYLHEIEDPAGRISRLERDAQGRLLSVRYPDGSQERYAYDSDNLLVSRWDERRNLTRYVYDGFGRVEKIQLADGSERSLMDRGQAGLHKPGSGTVSSPMEGTMQDSAETGARAVDARGNMRQRKLDSHSAAVLTQDAVGRVTMHMRDADSNAMQTMRPNRSVVNRTFNDQGNVLSQTEQFNGATTRYTYDEYSLMTSMTNPRGNTMRYTRDARGNVIRMENAAGHVTTRKYDSRGLVTEETTLNGLVLTYAYNTQGLAVRIVETPPSDSPGRIRTTQLEYHPTGLLSRIIMPDGIVQTLEYDARSRPISSRDSLGREQHTGYDAYGNVIRQEVQDAGGTSVRSVRAEYNRRNWEIVQARPHTVGTESISRSHWDAEGNVIGYVAPNGVRSRMEFDSVNRLSRSIHRLEGVTEYTYDDLDRLIRIQAPNGVVTKYVYDVLGRKIEEQSPDRGMIKYAYDLADNIISITEGRGIAIRYAYDILERVTEIRYPNTHSGKDETIRYTWDACTLGKDRLCAVQDESGTTSYRYDVWGNILERRHTELGVT